MDEKLCKIIYTISFFLSILKEGFSNPFKKVKCNTSKKMMILANGPSLKTMLSEIGANIDKYKGFEFSVINDFVHNPLFEKLKPKHYTLSDPMFFRNTPQRERGLGVMNKLAEIVDWDMYLYVRKGFKNSEYLNILSDNHYIKVVYYHHKRYDGARQLRNWLYKHGWGNGEYSTVVLNSIYVAITEGYKDIELYGVDHTFFNGLTVNDDNIPCYIYQHSFDNESEVKPIRYTYGFGRQYMDMASFIYEKYDIFSGHNLMSQYAKYMGCKIVNCTKGSLIDSYERIK